MNLEDTSEKLSIEKDINQLNHSFDSDESLIDAFMKIIGHWPLKSEKIDNIEYQYWVNDEAFNWHLLATRIIFSITEANNKQILNKLLHSTYLLPGTDQRKIINLFSPDKYRAHLNFIYGVVLEEVIICFNEMEKNKDVINQFNASDAINAVYLDLYGYNFSEFIRVYEFEKKIKLDEFNSLYSYYDFLYWSWKYRLKKSTPEKIAYDSQSGINFLMNMNK
tara:strand:+ start:1541 stop:2203 length:663 start_codon:yes stop_codon:yes gene_type:complete